MDFKDSLIELQDPISNPDLKNENVFITRNQSVDKLIEQLHDDSFEWFIHEWCFGYKKEQYPGGIFRVGGSGDKGRDIACFVNDKSSGNYIWDNYQCKYYKDPLTPTDIWKEVGKTIYFSFISQYPKPRSYYFIGKKDVGPKLLDYLKDTDVFRKDLKGNWDKHCKDHIMKGSIILDEELSRFIDNFDFKIFKTIPIIQIFEEHSKSRYHYMRFGVVDRVPRPEPKIPTEEIALGEEEMPYIKDLLQIYSEDEGNQISTVNDLRNYQSYENFKRQRICFYFAEQLRTFGKETYPPDANYPDLMTQVYDGIVDTHELEYEKNSLRLAKVLAQASLVPISKDHVLSNCIKSSDKKGICHQLTNEGRIRWIQKKRG